MGIKDFSKAFDHVSEVRWRDFADKHIAIDAMTELYRSALGAKSINTLTDVNGNPTLHISTLLANIIEMERNNIHAIWCFDNSKINHNPAKESEMIKRREKKNKARNDLNNLENSIALALDDQDGDTDNEKEFFINVNKQVNKTTKSSDILTDIDNADNDNTDIGNATDNDDDDIDDADIDDDDKKKPSKLTKPKTKTKPTKESLEKQTFTIQASMIDDIKFILDCFGIIYLEAPTGYEAEHIAAYLSDKDYVDGVYSGDTDVIPFGGKVLYRRSSDKKIYKYTRDDILEQIKTKTSVKQPSLNDIRKICALLGCDFCTRTKGVGPKTIFKKYASLELSKEQMNALDEFKKQPDYSKVLEHNKDRTPFVDCEVEKLLTWLVNEKSFNRTRITTQLEKILDIKDGIGNPTITKKKK